MHVRSTISLILLLVTFLRSLLPVGFMLEKPGAVGDAFEIVFCTSQGMKSLFVDHDGLPVKPSSDTPEEHRLCPYAASGALAADYLRSPSVASQVEYAAVTYVLAVRVFAETPRSEANSARGPPLELI